MGAADTTAFSESTTYGSKTELRKAVDERPPRVRDLPAALAKNHAPASGRAEPAGSVTHPTDLPGHDKICTASLT